ncbi:ATP-binding response regulator [Pseudomonas fluorescens]|uniref:histidine kinase n=1 Tax=Pseudomonas fluorescens TaxID=294 RepID=A0A944E4F7_PSEFL|nr:hybrid sensor histidine kinase/response regulator [Pseudomonas fluorescens]MBT2294869.1 hybrid sensor histidine kinase/response regulator [Pseudomonas fluorescens]MBT2308439.1 hybrid sensor histidine kinase/response regulator [Pseudomonas fluorescens]MBT2311509.1 hybrid sensor histidine kinase/response regulator [Pseudomonas fluorescens]MBT2319826.1 hybrid sensor histidine kinase/response regulator [Pseudomonas fluorescens]MBT2332166.1 hybrid sensor histidine kinase/response regulator [Pseu
MAKPSDEQQKALAGLLGLGNHSTRKSHYPELAARLAELEQARQHLQQLNDQLEQRVAERTDALLEANHNLQQQIAQRELIEQQLRDARDAAQAANRSKDKYLAAASHDLLQPLNAARLLIATLRERTLPTSEHVLVERTHQALEGAEDLLTDLLDISRLDQAAVKPDLAPYRLDELLAPLASEFQSVAGAAGLELRVRFGDEAVMTDLRLMTRILRNLLSNACRYTAQGGILLAARRRGERLSLEVWDTGRGIAADRLESIFLEFNQLDVGRAADRKGVGLGLAIVERIAHVLGYRVQVRSRPGRGSVFSIEVPLSTERPPPMPRIPVQAVAGNPLPGRRLLVIDNELSILQSMAALLGQWGCEVLIATDEAAAFDVLQGRAPELILADFHLDHGVVGCEVVKHLREHFQQAIPAVIITADRSDQCRRALRKLNAPLLNKPVKPGKLRAVLSQLLG